MPRSKGVGGQERVPSGVRSGEESGAPEPVRGGERIPESRLRGRLPVDQNSKLADNRLALAAENAALREALETLLLFDEIPRYANARAAIDSPQALTAAVQEVVEAFNSAVDHLNALLSTSPQPQGEEDEEGQGLIQENPE